MSILLALAASGGGTPPISVTYTSSQTVTIPAGVSNLVSVSGKGASGSPASYSSVRQYSKTTTEYVQRMDQGGRIDTYRRGTVTVSGGPVPSDYCDPPTAFDTGGVTSYDQVCYSFSDTSYTNSYPQTTGAASTGFGLTFPGGVGGPATTQTSSNVGVTPGAQYPIVVPAGGSITISYYA